MKLNVDYNNETFDHLKNHGKKDDLVIFKRAGKGYVRARSKKVNRSENSKTSSRMFGIASSRGKTFRQLLVPVLHFPRNRTYRKFAGAIHRSIKCCEFEVVPMNHVNKCLRHFSFNTAAAVHKHWKVDIRCRQVEANKIEINIPGFVPQRSFKAPAGTSSIECTFAAACVRMADGTAIGHDHISIAVPYHDSNEPVRSISLTVATGRGCFVIIAAALAYKLSNGERDDRIGFLPSSVIDAWYIE